MRQLSDRLRVPTDFRHLAELTARWHGLAHRALELKASTVLQLFEHCDALRRPDPVPRVPAGLRGRLPRPYRLGSTLLSEAGLLASALEAALAATLDASERRGLSGEQIGEALRKKRLKAVGAAMERGWESSTMTETSAPWGALVTQAGFVLV